MPNPKCLKCDSDKFEMGTISLSNIDVVIKSIQCSSCASVLGVLPDFNAESTHKSLVEKADKIGNIVSTINRQMIQIQNDIVALKFK